MKSAKMVPLNDYVSLRDEILGLHNQIAQLQQQLAKAQLNNNALLDKGIFVGLNSNSRFVRVGEVVYIEAHSNYSTIYLDDKSTILTSKTLKYWEEKFTSPHLIRVHQSFLVNIKKIDQIDFEGSCLVLTNKNKVSMSKSGKKLLKNLS